MDVDVRVTDEAIIRVLNSPGGAVARWRDEVMVAVEAHAQANSPVNDPLNAVHRGGAVGEYASSWFATGQGSNGHTVRARIGNTSGHAQVVEYGRSASGERQTFSWTAWEGQIRTVGGPGRKGTSARVGKHVLRDAINAVLPAATGGTFSGIV